MKKFFFILLVPIFTFLTPEASAQSSELAVSVNTATIFFPGCSRFNHARLDFVQEEQANGDIIIKGRGFIIDYVYNRKAPVIVTATYSINEGGTYTDVKDFRVTIGASTQVSSIVIILSGANMFIYANSPNCD